MDEESVSHSSVILDLDVLRDFHIAENKKRERLIAAPVFCTAID
jgi:hypothetical protein